MANEAFFTLISPHWEIPALDLPQFDPEKMLWDLRSMLWSHGADVASGYLFAGLHSEFDLEAAMWRHHVHGIARGGMISVVEDLRNTSKFRPNLHPASTSRRATPGVQISRNPLTNLPAPYTYCVQSFWPLRSFVDAGSGERKRGNRRRIPEPYHSLYLLWLDRWRLEQLTLLISLRATSAGLIPNRSSI